MILASNLAYMWDTVVGPRLGVAPYVFGGSFSPTDPTVGDDCSGAVSDELGALVFGPAMPWPRQFWTGTFAGAQPGDTGPFGGLPVTAPLICIPGPDAMPGAAMIIAVNQNPDPAQAHMIAQVGGVNIEMGGQSDNYHTSLTDPTCADIHDAQFDQWFALPGPIGTPLQGLDYAGGRPPGADIIRAGFQFVCRYLFDGSPGLPDKLLTAAEAQDLQNAGVEIVSNWEATATNALGGFSQGVSDAQAANANHLAAGGPPSAPIYFSVDFDAAESDQSTINAYFTGVISVIGLGRSAAYGGYWVVKRLFDAGLISYGWQAEAWSSDPGGLGPDDPFGDGCYLDPRANILQRNNLGYVTIDGVQCDQNASLTDNFGQWSYQTAPVSPGPPTAPQANTPGLPVPPNADPSWFVLCNLIPSLSPYAPSGTLVMTKDLIADIDARTHRAEVERNAMLGDPASVAMVKALAATGDSVAQLVYSKIETGKTQGA